MLGTALVFAGSDFGSPYAKTAHGLIRGTERFQVLAIFDQSGSIEDAGVRLDGKHRDIPTVNSLEAFLQQFENRADYLVIGIASAGGKLEKSWLSLIQQALESGMGIVNGLHEFVSDIPDLARLAEEKGVSLIDVRKPKPRSAQYFWEGSIDQVQAKKIAVLGTDCAVGKRTTARMLTQALNQEGKAAEMIYTGQTGWMQGYKYGFIFDSTLNDFVSGELERAICQCDQEAKPDVIFLEGQSALRNPSGPCGSEFLISGRSDGVILVHPPARTLFKGWEHLNRRLPSPAEEIALIQSYGVPVLGLALNTKGLTGDEARSYQETYEQELGIPVCLPIEEGVSKLVDAVLA